MLQDEVDDAGPSGTMVSRHRPLSLFLMPLLTLYSTNIFLTFIYFAYFIPVQLSLFARMFPVSSSLSFLIMLGTAHYLQRGLALKRNDFLAKKSSSQPRDHISIYLYNLLLSESFHLTNAFMVPNPQ